VLTADDDRAVEIGQATLVLRAGSSIRPDERDDGRVELDSGEIEVTVPAGHAFVVRSGEFDVKAEAARFSVRHTAGVPVVTVGHGDVVLFGPDLPASGIRILASP
jgi:ferric-dicitrate binding protein FerR (iron transport regulator)